MCDGQIDKREVERRFDISFDLYFAGSIEKLSEFQADGFIELTDNAIAVNGLGRLIIRNIAMCFDAYIDTMMQERPIFSRTV
jgi:oxygen-independent coproporphyrinogen-3 oxidase